MIRSSILLYFFPTLCVISQYGRPIQVLTLWLNFTLTLIFCAVSFITCNCGIVIISSSYFFGWINLHGYWPSVNI